MIPAPTDPGRRDDERATLVGFLDHFRTVLLRKADGLAPDQLSATVASSSLTLGGLVRHMALVEDHWFNDVFAGLPEREPWASMDWDADPDAEMNSAAGMAFSELRTDFDASCERSRSVLATVTSLDQVAAAGDREEPLSMRWILVHMIEEYARHCGHADLLREAIDGHTGD